MYLGSTEYGQLKINKYIQISQYWTSTLLFSVKNKMIHKDCHISYICI